MGTTAFGKDKNAYTGCDCDTSGCICTKNQYTLGKKSTKARMITVQEANAVGCTGAKNSCPTWMRTGPYYWTMSADSSFTLVAWLLYTTDGYVFGHRAANTDSGARAVVVISK